MKLYKIRVTAEVLETAHETRRVNVDSHVLTFGRQPAYIRAVKLPPQLADDPYLRIEAVDTPPSGVPIIHLKSERRPGARGRDVGRPRDRPQVGTGPGAHG